MNDEVKSIVSTKNKDESIQAEVWIVPNYKPKEENSASSFVLEQRITDLKMKIESLDDTIERLESSADGIDYAVAAACGVIAGVLDTLFIDEFSLDRAKAFGSEKTSTILSSLSAKEGYTTNTLNDSIHFLSNKYQVTGDIQYSPTIAGLLISVICSVGGVALGMGKTGYILVEKASNMGLSDRIFRGIADWGCHAVCGMDSNTKTTGLPGPIQTLLKKCSSMNTLDASNPKTQTKLEGFLDSAFQGAKGGSGFSLETELGVAAQIGTQAIPVLINEAVVRAFYFIRRFFMEISFCNVRSIHDLYKIDWRATLPFGNRTIARMMSVSTLAMTTVDMAGAAIESIGKSSSAGMFFTNFVLRLNYVGLGRTVIACTTDGIMGGKLGRKRQERITLVAEYLELNKEQLLYKQKDMWVAADKTEEVIDEAVATMKKTDQILRQTIQENKESMTRISVTMDQAEAKNPGLKDSIKDTLKW